MTKQYEPSGTEKFFGGGNFLIQMSLLIGIFFYSMFIADLPPLFNILAVIAGFILFISISILSGAYATRYDIYNKYVEDGMKATAHNKEVKPHLPIPPLKVCLIRSTIARIIFLIGAGILLFIGFSSTEGMRTLIMPLEENSGAMHLIMMMTMLPVFILILGLIVGLYMVSPAIVDATLYRNELIIAHLYEDGEKPMTWGKFGKSLWKLIRVTLGFALSMTVLLGVRIGLEVLDEADPPLHIFFLITILMFIPLIGFSWWSVKRQSERKANEYMKRLEEELIEHHGENSDEVAQFRAELAEYNAMSKEEKKALATETKEEEPEQFSVMRQVMTGVAFLFMGGMILTIVLTAIVTITAGGLGVRGVALEIASKGTMLAGLATIGILFFRRLRHFKFNLLEEFTKMAEVADSGDYKTAMELADIAREKINLSEFGYTIGMVYMMGGDLEKAENILRDSLREIMFIKAEDRNAIFLSQTLTSLGALHIEKGDYDEAEAIFLQSLQQDKKNPWTLSNLAELSLYRKDPQDALEYIEHAIKANEQKPEKERANGANYLMFKAWALTQMRQYEKTVPLMREAFIRAKDNHALQAELHYYSGLIALERGKITTANIAFQRAIDALPGSLIAIKAQRLLDNE